MSSVDVEYGAQMEREAQRYKAQRDEAIRRAEQRIAELEAENERLRATNDINAQATLGHCLRAQAAEQQLAEARAIIGKYGRRRGGKGYYHVILGQDDWDTIMRDHAPKAG